MRINYMGYIASDTVSEMGSLILSSRRTYDSEIYLRLEMRKRNNPSSAL